MKVIDYLNPFQDKIRAWKKFRQSKTLNLKDRVFIIFVSCLAAIASIPLFGLGGLAAFRAMVNRFTFKKLNTKDHQGAAKIDHAVFPDGKFLAEQPKEEELPDLNAEPSHSNSSSVNKSQVPQGMTDPCPQTIHNMTRKEYLAHAKAIRVTLRKREKEPKILEMADELFLKELGRAKKNALQLHKTFKKRFGNGPKPKMEQNSGVIFSTLFQLETAAQMFQKKEEKLVSIAYNDEQKIAVARLIQYVLIGQIAEKYPMPKSPCCFKLFELQGKKTAPITKRFKKTNYLDHFIDNFDARFKKLSKHDRLKQNLDASLNLFVNDCIDRNLYSFTNGKTEILLGLRAEKNDDDPSAFVDVVKTSYIDFLKKQKALVKEIIADYNQTEIIQFLRKNFCFDQSIFLDSTFPEIILQKLFEPIIIKYGQKEKVVKNILAILERSRISDQDLADLVSLTGMEKREVEPLVRLKILETILLMNQASTSDGPVELFKMLSAYTNENEVPILNPSGISSQFCFFSAKKHAFRTFSNKTKVDLIVHESHFPSEKVLDCVSEKITVATVDMEDTVKDYTRKSAIKTVVPIANITFNWQAPLAIVEHLIKQIDSSVVDQKSQLNYADLSLRVERANEILFQVASSMQKLVPEKNLSLQEMQSLTNNIRNCAYTTEEYLRQSAKLQKKNVALLCFLQGHRGRYEDAFNAIKKLKIALLSCENQDDKVRVLSGILDEISKVILLLPKKNEKFLTPYFECFYGAFAESNNPKSIAWKIKKYESQVVELRDKLKLHFAAALKDSNDDLDGSWVLVDASSGSLHPVRELLSVLESVDLDLQNPERFTQHYLTDVRELYNRKFIPLLRKALQQDPDNLHLQKVCEILFTEITLEQECYETLDFFDKCGSLMLGHRSVDKKNEKGFSFVKELEALYERTGAVPYSAKAPILNQWCNSARGQWNRNFDPTCQGNPIHVIYHILLGKKRIKGIGMGSPTIEDHSSKASLTPEFTAFLKSYKREKKKHLFVLNQNTIPKSDWLSMITNGDETNRCKEILDIALQIEFKETLYCISLAKNSPFYEQTGPFRNRSNARVFKRELFHQVLLGPKEKTGCFISNNLRQAIPGFQRRVKSMITSIHEHLFGKKMTLSFDERKIFIEIFYDSLVKFLLKELDVDSFNISCKDAIDRGAASNAQLFSHLSILGGEISPLLQKKIASLMMVRALLVRKRPPIKERFTRFSEVLTFSMEHKLQLKDLHQELFKKTQFIPL